MYFIDSEEQQLQKCCTNDIAQFMYLHNYAKRSKIALEITILKSMECKDKSIIPSSLKYRDRGFMYFPDPSFIPFIKAVDDKVRSIANSDNIKNHGSNIIAVASEIVKADSSLPKLFENTLGGKIDCMDGRALVLYTVNLLGNCITLVWPSLLTLTDKNKQLKKDRPHFQDRISEIHYFLSMQI